ncbi:class II aldolase/adducin family protein [Herbaspirillum rubrisubalbicans]|uniref:class II aldolase/adducin family protein n=1 Tax=Herbaspirillum rubrisubalbicans TaxID=80842 RepID=UPI0015592196|nr:class II aldolase/adducin family protein [Herbaspirillum rubrisubalbicans]NQE51536.1 hypothetical protein [Herbaspirillum rubrisubalbicans]
MTIRQEVFAYSARIGADEMLIQGAGGNASWKDDTTMWIKASGTWLSEALVKDIFVPIDIPKTLALIASGATDLSSARIGDSPLRPSIETCLHALLPQRFVVHFHAVEVIAHAVTHDAREALHQRLAGLDWAWVDYVKPGPDLARAVTNTIGTGKAPDILVLGNHGLVVAADTLAQLDVLRAEVLARCHLTPRDIQPATKLDALAAQWLPFGYVLPAETRCHALATDATCLRLSASAWVMYPDHAVFLGPRATILDAPWPSPTSVLHRPECVIAPGRGVVVRKDLSPGQLAMLTCYADVTLRLNDANDVAPLKEEQIADLLNWDAEKYRQSLNAI